MRRVKDIWRGLRQPSKAEIERVRKILEAKSVKNVRGDVMGALRKGRSMEETAKMIDNIKEYTEQRKVQLRLKSANHIATRQAILVFGIKDRKVQRELYKETGNIVKRLGDQIELDKDSGGDVATLQSIRRIRKMLGKRKGEFFIRFHANKLYSLVRRLFENMMEEDASGR